MTDCNEIWQTAYLHEKSWESKNTGTPMPQLIWQPFYRFLRSNQNRVVSLLNSLGLQKQFITSIDQISINKRIDWSIVNQKIRVSKESSESFLLSSIQYCIKKQQ